MIQHILAAHEYRYQRAHLSFINGRGDKFEHFRESTASCYAIVDLDPAGVGSIYPEPEPESN